MDFNKRLLAVLYRDELIRLLGQSWREGNCPLSLPVPVVYVPMYNTNTNNTVFI